MRRVLLLGLVAAVVVLAAPVGAQPTEVPVTAKGTRFNNSGDCNAPFVGTVTEVSVGDTVMWRNCDTAISHTVTSDQNKFPTQPLPPGGAARLRFDSPGRFEYFCEIHGRTMQGTVVVRAAQAATTVPPAATTTPPTTAPAATTSSAAPTTTTSRPPTTTTTSQATTTTTTEATTTSTKATTTTSSDEDVDLDEAAAEDEADEGAEPLLVLAIVIVLAAIAVVGTLVWRSRRSGWR